MKKNVGSTDRIIRVIIAIVAVWAAYTGKITSPWDNVLYVVGAIMAVTALFACCPLYNILGLKTCCDDESCEVK